MNKCTERIYNGIIKENPTFVLMLGMCPTLAVTTSAVNGIGMGLSTTVVLVLSNLMISALRKIIPDRVRMPAFIVIVASFVTMVQFLVQGFLPSLYDALGIYIPLIVVNCIILGRAESYASKNPVLPSLFDGLGMGLGFTLGLTCIGLFRQLLGSKITIFVLAPGAFFVLAALVAAMNVIRRRAERRGKPLPAPAGCLAGDCGGCAQREICSGKAGSAAVAAQRAAAVKAEDAAAVKAEDAAAVKEKDAAPVKEKDAAAVKEKDAVAVKAEDASALEKGGRNR